MTTKTYVYSTTLTVTSCGVCAIPFAIPDNLYTSRHGDGLNFYCPNGHCISWKETEAQRLKRDLSWKETEAQRLKRDLKWERDRAASVRARADGAEASLRATKGHVTRLRKRVLNGECPLCGQHLRDVARHVKRVHPDETPETKDLA